MRPATSHTHEVRDKVHWSCLKRAVLTRSNRVARLNMKILLNVVRSKVPGADDFMAGDLEDEPNITVDELFSGLADRTTKLYETPTRSLSASPSKSPSPSPTSVQRTAKLPTERAETWRHGTRSVA